MIRPIVIIGRWSLLSTQHQWERIIKLNVVGAYALDFAGYEHNPNTFYVGADMPLLFYEAVSWVGVSS